MFQRLSVLDDHERSEYAQIICPTAILQGSEVGNLILPKDYGQGLPEVMLDVIHQQPGSAAIAIVERMNAY